MELSGHPADPQVCSSPLHRALEAEEEEAELWLSPPTTADLRSGSLVVYDGWLQNKAQKHRSERVDRRGREWALRAGSLQPVSGAFFCIHGTTV